MFPGELFGGLDPIHVGQPQVHHDHIRVGLPSTDEGLLAIRRFGDHDSHAAALEHLAKGLAPHGVVVDDHHGDRFGCHFSILSPGLVELTGAGPFAVGGLTLERHPVPRRTTGRTLG